MTRRLTLAALDLALLSAAYVLAYWLRLGNDGLPERLPVIAETLPILLAISLYVHLRFGLFHAILRYASAETAVAVVKAVGLSLLLSLPVFFLASRLEGVPRSVFAIHFMAAVLLVGGSRFAARVVLRGPDSAASRRVLLLGATDLGADAARALRRSPDAAAAGFLDDDPAQHGASLGGLPVLGGLDRLPDVAAKTGARELWVCLPDLPGERLREILRAATAAGLALKVVPPLSGPGAADLAHFREPRIEDLLSRPPRRLDRALMRRWLEGRRVLVTGAGGSIGSELCRRVAELGPERLVLCDASELNLFSIDRELRPRRAGLLSRPWLVDVADEARVAAMFEEEKPSVVFHAAAYKHVPLVELNPCQGVRNNVGGTRAVALAAREHGAADVVLISTDKAVRPANVMGATKRLGELIVRTLQREGRAKFMAVRFGNVLGSSGSVIPIFREQIRAGGPVTVTHPEMSRYFMLVTEAAELVIQAGSIGRGGEVFLLDMGAPVRIAETAETLIRLMGRRPGDDVRIEFTGVRPGEKIREELLVSPRDARTDFPDLWIDHEPPPPRTWADLSADLDGLLAAADAGDVAATLERLRALVPEYGPAAPLPVPST
jgi:FlaA1/EpsC-like NDP-sugar epimerase